MSPLTKIQDECVTDENKIDKITVPGTRTRSSARPLGYAGPKCPVIFHNYLGRNLDPLQPERTHFVSQPLSSRRNKRLRSPFPPSPSFPSLLPSPKLIIVSTSGDSETPIQRISAAEGNTFQAGKGNPSQQTLLIPGLADSYRK